MVLLSSLGGDDDNNNNNNKDETSSFLARLRGPLEYDDPGLLDVLRHSHLVPPSPRPYALTRDRNDYQAGVYNMYIVMDIAYLALQKLLKEVFADVKSGFFVEAGAVDGEFLSNTLFLERKLGWTGLLVEADGDMYSHLLRRHRKAWSCHCCLSPHSYPHREILIKYSGLGKSHPGMSMFARGHGVLASHEKVSPVKLTGGKIDGGAVQLFESVQCFPLASLLLALNTTYINFVSLDVEGPEESILHSFPWSRITVDVWLVEHISPASYGHHKEQSPSQKRTKKQDYFIPNKVSLSANVDKQINNKSHISDNMHDTLFQSEKSTVLNFIEFFVSRGYDMYPTDPASLLDNYLFIRRGSQVHRSLKVFKTKKNIAT
ncbi:hypothetical protein Pcinc_023122 [Petrolisthes cinctipes]|uniref:Methyltransferase FkbM domain-containing protein n=1 Tax=Petrolisthes cinctipes TaxID=88211 RepID=A0AAE1FE57_PETCI|nr:hypothetical protein Pcinc_023122 [Petrolisthes cinctipes]